MSSIKKRLAVVLGALLMVSCALPVSDTIQASPAQLDKYNELAALEVVTALEKNVDEARNANMGFLAPGHFSAAAQILSENQRALGNKPKEEIANNAAKADAILEKGRAIMAIVQYRFSQELMLKAKMEEHQTAKFLPEDYEKVIGKFSTLIEKVERKNPENIDQEKDALLKQMLGLVVKSIQEGALRQSEVLNADTRKKNAEAQAPLTFAEAEQIYQDAKNRIAAAHDDQKLVESLSEKALFAAHHAQQINDRVALLQTRLGLQIKAKPAAAGPLSLEQIVLQEEDRLRGIAAALGLKDLRDQPLDRQVEEIKRAIGKAAHQAESEACSVTVQDLNSCLKAFNDSVQHEIAEQAEEDRQKIIKARQMEEQNAHMAEKEAQIKSLEDQIKRLESAARAKKIPKAVKPATTQPQSR